MRPGMLSVMGCAWLSACSAVVTAPPPAQPEPTATTAQTVFGECVEGSVSSATSVLLAWRDGRASWVQADGATAALYDFGEGFSPVSVPQTRDGWTLLHAVSGRPQHEEHRVVLINPAGAVAWAQTIAVEVTVAPLRRGWTPSVVSLGAMGHVAMMMTAWTDGHPESLARHVSPDGRATDLADASPVMAPDAAGRVLVRTTGTSGAESWWTPANGRTEPVARESEEVSPCFAVGDAVVHYAAVPEGVFLVRDRGGREDRVRLPFARRVSELRVSGSERAPWLLFTSGREASDREVHRLNVSTLALETLRVELPSGRDVTMYSELAIDTDGALLGSFRDAEWAQLYRSSDGVRWTSVGRPTTGALSTFVSDHAAGSYVIVGTNARYGGDEWPEVVRDEPEGLRGISLHIARPTDGVSLVLRGEDPDALEPQSVTLSPNGRCAAWVSADRTTPALRVVRVRDGAIVEVALPARSTDAGIVQFAWRH